MAVPMEMVMVGRGWVARQNGHGLLEYHHLASGRISAAHPSHPAVAAKDEQIELARSRLRSQAVSASPC